MKEHPIIFSTNMVIAILEGKKTQTRRVIKPKPSSDVIYFQCADEAHVHPIFWEALDKDKSGFDIYRCPYGIVGDRLWVRESFRIADGGSIYYKADEDWNSCPDWKPSIHMPRWTSRITLEITDIRVERVQEISIKDSVAEGVPCQELGITNDELCRAQFADIWDSINAKRENVDEFIKFGWDRNPWVWVIAFRRIDGVTAD